MLIYILEDIFKLRKLGIRVSSWNKEPYMYLCKFMEDFENAWI